MITVEPMDRRDFLWRLWIGAAFALAGIPLLGDVLREWATTKQRERTARITASEIVAARRDAIPRYVDTRGRRWFVSVPSEVIVPSGRENRWPLP